VVSKCCRMYLDAQHDRASKPARFEGGVGASCRRLLSAPLVECVWGVTTSLNDSPADEPDRARRASGDGSLLDRPIDRIPAPLFNYRRRGWTLSRGERCEDLS
jgi:hypothetical protein